MQPYIPHRTAQLAQQALHKQTQSTLVKTIKAHRNSKKKGAKNKTTHTLHYL